MKTIESDEMGSIFEIRAKKYIKLTDKNFKSYRTHNDYTKILRFFETFFKKWTDRHFCTLDFDTGTRNGRLETPFFEINGLESVRKKNQNESSCTFFKAKLPIWSM